jgi:hypothetical protein
VRIDVQYSKLSGGKKYRNAAQVGHRSDREPTASSVIQLLPPMQDARRLVSAENSKIGTNTGLCNSNRESMCYLGTGFLSAFSTDRIECNSLSVQKPLFPALSKLGVFLPQLLYFLEGFL